MSKKKRKSKRKLKASRAEAKMAHQVTNRPSQTSQPETPTAKQEEYLPLERELLANVRTQWIFGDWSGLAGLERHRIEHHPDRAQLALYIAAGNAQLGQDAAAREFAALAREWGCNREFMAQILISGTYNSLARSSALNGQHERFERHLATAMATGSPGLDLATAIRARRAEPMPQLGNNGAFEVLETRSGSSPNGHAALSESPDIAAPSEALMQIAIELAQELREVKAGLAQQITKQTNALNSFRTEMKRAVKQEMLNATKQLEAFMDIQSFFHKGEKLPAMHGWPVSPDFARHLIDLLERNDYDLILEFGSGTSTIIIAKALAHLDRSRHGKPSAVQVAFEHLEKYHAQTLSHLESAGLAESVDVFLTPLEPYEHPNGNTYAYYACHEILGQLVKRLPASPIKILMVVDGPPASTGKHARYPALPAVIMHLRNNYLDIILDDFARQDEQEVGDLWGADLRQLGYKFRFEKISLERDALFISACPE